MEEDLPFLFHLRNSGIGGCRAINQGSKIFKKLPTFTRFSQHILGVQIFAFLIAKRIGSFNQWRRTVF